MRELSGPGSEADPRILAQNILRQSMEEDARLQRERSSRGAETIRLLTKMVEECGMIRRHLERIYPDGGSKGRAP